MDEQQFVALLEPPLQRFQLWKQRSRQLYELLSDQVEVATSAEEPPLEIEGPGIDHILLDKLLSKSRNVLCVELRQAIERIKKDSTEDNPHPAMLKFGMLGERSINGCLGEVDHTRLLAWILDPGKEHGFGDSALRAMISLTKLRDLSGAKISDVEVYPEYVTNNNRIDIFIQGKADGTPFSVWIEAKLESQEGKDQISRYSSAITQWRQGAIGKTPRSAAVFLTPEGRTPSSLGMASVNWQALSFSALALRLWENIRDKTSPAKDLLRIYLASILSDIWALRRFMWVASDPACPG